MLLASLHHNSFLTNPLITKIPTHNFKPKTQNHQLTISFKHPQNDHHQNQNNSSRKVENQLRKLAVVTLSAAVLTLGSVSVSDDASAAKSTAHLGAHAHAPPFSSSPRVNSRNIYVNPPTAPPLVGGYGFGLGVPIYGGWSPFTFFAPGPSVSMGIGGGFDLLVLFMVFGAVASVFRGFRGSRVEDDYY